MTNQVPADIRKMEKQYKGQHSWPLDSVEYKIDFTYGEMLVAGFTAPSPIPIPSKGDTIVFEITPFYVVDVQVSYWPTRTENGENKKMSVSAAVAIRPVDPGHSSATA